MSTFGCECGYIIRFNTVPCRYDGAVVRDMGSEAVYDAATDQIGSFIAAIREGRRDEWLHGFYGSTFAIKDGEAVSDIFDRHVMPSTLALHQCERCGRLWLQRATFEPPYESYLPEGNWQGALEMPAEGFVGYVASQHFFDSRIESVRQEDGRAWVTLLGDTGRRQEAVFTGVTALRNYDDAREEQVRFLERVVGCPSAAPISVRQHRSKIQTTAGNHGTRREPVSGD